MRHSSPLLLANIAQLVTVRNGSKTAEPLRGARLRQLEIIRDAAVLCLGGKIVSVGTTKDALQDPWIRKNRRKISEIDCRNCVVVPGFVDSHTHPVFTEPRLIDFEKRISGASYEEIAEAGGGIRSSIEGVRSASRSALTTKVLATLNELAKHGTTTVEAKSGYGLSLESELKSLESIRTAARQWPGTVVPTFLGAHVVPPEFRERRQAYIELVCKEMLPAVAKSKLARFVDVFCDRGAFGEKETATIFGAAAAHRLEVRAHLGQLSAPTEGFIESLLQTCRPASLDHMDYVSDSDVAALAASNTVVTVVPGANYFLGLNHYPDARRMIDAGVSVALATDFNPGTSPTISMPMAMSLACTQLKMTLAEAIAAATINGAHALGLADRKGSIETGKDADLSVFDVNDYREIPYWFGANKCIHTIISGTLKGC